MNYRISRKRTPPGLAHLPVFGRALVRAKALLVVENGNIMADLCGSFVTFAAYFV